LVLVFTDGVAVAVQWCSITQYRSVSTRTSSQAQLPAGATLGIL
jgi:hypothetical protein